MFRSSLDICIQLVSHTYIKQFLYLFRCVSFIWVYVYNVYQRPPAAAGEQRHTMGRNCRGHNRLIVINRMAPTEPAQRTATPQPPPEKSQKGSGTGRPNHWYSPLADPASLWRETGRQRDVPATLLPGRNPGRRDPDTNRQLLIVKHKISLYLDVQAFAWVYTIHILYIYKRYTYLNIYMSLTGVGSSEIIEMCALYPTNRPLAMATPRWPQTELKEDM